MRRHRHVVGDDGVDLGVADDVLALDLAEPERRRRLVGGHADEDRESDKDCGHEAGGHVPRALNSASVTSVELPPFQ